MLQRCDTESIIPRETGGDGRMEGERMEEEGYMPNRQNHIRMNHTRVRAQVAKTQRRNLFRAVVAGNLECGPV